MPSLPPDADDPQIIDFIDEWVRLLEKEDYDSAFGLTEHSSHMGWTPNLIERVIKAYGDELPNQRVTLRGVPSDVTQRKNVDWWQRGGAELGQVWYDLNIDCVVSDLTATFDVERTSVGVSITLNDIHVM